jgi:fatty acid desaturase
MKWQNGKKGQRGNMKAKILTIIVTLIIALGFPVIGLIAYGWAGLVFGGVSAVVAGVVLWRGWLGQ